MGEGRGPLVINRKTGASRGTRPVKYLYLNALYTGKDRLKKVTCSTKVPSRCDIAPSHEVRKHTDFRKAVHLPGTKQRGK